MNKKIKFQKEITVQVECDYEELHKELIKNRFKIKQEYQVNDNYMVDNSININSLTKLEVLKKCVLIRNIVGIKKVLLYKYKKFENNGDIIEQSNIECPIEDTEKAENFMKFINYRHLFKISDKCIVYNNGKTELVVQLVNNKYIFIEMESEAKFINKKYHTISEMITDIEQYNLPYSKDSYFVKKAEIVLKDTIDFSIQ